MRSNRNRAWVSALLAIILSVTVASTTAASGGLPLGGSFVDGDGNIHEDNT